MIDTLVIFDIDGTLTDTVALHQQCFTNALETSGLKKSAAFSSFKHHTDRFIFRDIYYQNHDTHANEEQVTEFYKLICNDFYRAEALTEIKGAKQFIANLISNNVPFCFATGSISELALKKLSLFNLPQAEQLLAHSDITDSREKIVLKAIELAKAFYHRDSFTNIIAFGDGKWDYVTAQNLSLGFIGIGDNPTLMELMKDTPVEIWRDFSNKTYEDISKYVRLTL